MDVALVNVFLKGGFQLVAFDFIFWRVSHSHGFANAGAAVVYAYGLS